MKLNLRKEEEKDYPVVFALIEKAFKGEKYSDHREQFLVERLRKSEGFVPELSLVAEIDNQVVGHILLTKIKIKNENEIFYSLALAPVSVLPKFQKRGIGARLIELAHKRAKNLGFTSVVLLGHENYYPKFGYKPAHTFNIEIPFDAPPENCMAIELVKNGLKNVSGKVEYDKAFYE